MKISVSFLTSFCVVTSFEPYISHLYNSVIITNSSHNIVSLIFTSPFDDVYETIVAFLGSANSSILQT
jgi:hypothetical protein